jgi:phospholipid transport system substrate-binding protein
MIKKFLYSLVAVLFFYQGSSLQAATDNTTNARAFIEDLGRRAIDSLTKSDVSQSQLESNFQALLEEGFDIQGIGKFVMGRYWSRMTDDQQTRFIPLFENRLKKSYANRFQQYRGVVFTVKDARQEDNSVIVTSTIQKPGGPATPVDWRVSGGKIQDVKVEGVSMSITIRDEYSALVQSNNGDIEKFMSTLGGPSSGKSTLSAGSSKSDDDQ